MLAVAARADAYTFSEYEATFRDAGFNPSELHPLAGMPASMMVSRV